MLFCPISRELPFDPVTANDGRVYEREAIEEWLKGKPDNQIKSPMTNNNMSKELLPAPHTKNAIKILIEDGIIDGESAKVWKEKEWKEMKQHQLLQKAEAGDVIAMEDLATHFVDGTLGFKKSTKDGFKWFERAHIAGSVYGTAVMGDMLVAGAGVTKQTEKGIMHLGIAIGYGSKWAACALGFILVDGRHGVPIDVKEGCRLLKLSLDSSCPHNRFCEGMKKEAQEKLEKFHNETPGN